MKVSANGAPSQLGAASRGSRAGAGGFSVAAATGAPEAAGASVLRSVSGVSSLDALLALQEAPSPGERRRRAIRRATGLLDALDQVKLTLLGDGDPQRALDGLRRAAMQAREGGDDPALDEVLDQVDLRAEVELAKDEMARRAVALRPDNSPRVDPGEGGVISAARRSGAPERIV